MEDITPKMLEDIQADFDSIFEKSEKIKKIYEKMRAGTATYIDANEFAIETGEILSRVFQAHLSSDVLPDGRMYYNIAQRILQPTLENNYNLVSEVSMEVQEQINKANGIGIKAVKPELNQDRIDGIVDVVSGKGKYDDIAYMLGEPIVNFAQSVVDATVKANADFQYNAGMSPKIRRTVAGGCCDWCAKLAGTYNYEDVSDTGNPVFRRHKYCRCLVEYEEGGGKVQNVHTKKWSDSKDIEQRIENSQRYVDDARKVEKRKRNARRRVAPENKKKAEDYIEKARSISSKDLDGMRLSELKSLAERTAKEYYSSGLSGISFGKANLEEAAEKLAAAGSRTSLKKDILSMQKKLKGW